MYDYVLLCTYYYIVLKVLLCGQPQLRRNSRQIELPLLLGRFIEVEGYHISQNIFTDKNQFSEEFDRSSSCRTAEDSMMERSY